MMEWILVPLAPFILAGFAIWSKNQRELAKEQVATTAENTAEKAAQYSSRVQELEDRVRVLERIVTDRGYDIATQIEALRDTRATDDRNAGVQMDFGRRETMREDV